MLEKIIGWSLDNVLIVLAATVGLIGFGASAFININVEAYPDPAPPIIEVIAQYPGATAEDVERQVTSPLEVTLAGMPGLKNTRTRSLFGLSHLRNQFNYSTSYQAARQEVINRLQFIQDLPDGVTPVLSPASPTGEIYRYTLRSPRDALNRDIYSLNDLKSLQDWSLERIFRRVPRIIDVTSSGGTVKRYEIHPDPDKLRRYGISLAQLTSAISNANRNTGGDVLSQGGNSLNVRAVGLYGGGIEPMKSKEVLSEKDPKRAADYLRSEDDRRIMAIRQMVITSINNHPIRVDNLVDGGPLKNGLEIGRRGVIVGHQTRLGKDSYSAPVREENGEIKLDKNGKPIWFDDEERVQCIVLLRKGEDTLPALSDVKKRVEQLNNEPGQLPPGIKIETYYDRTDLINTTTETVRENLLVGMSLVVMILLMFLSNIRVALIVAINIPLALLAAFAVLFMRGRSANLLSIGAVDFGIIVDSSVIMAENIYRHLVQNDNPNLSYRQKILKACSEIQTPLIFSTLIMMVAFIPLFTLKGAEGQLFGPMAETYAFALAGGLMLAVMLTPLLAYLLLKNIQPRPDNLLVQFFKRGYLKQLKRCLKYRYLTVSIMLGLLAMTIGALPRMGREFMPELEEGNLWVRGMFPRNSSLETVAEMSRKARAVLREYSEIELMMNLMGRPDDGTDPEGFYKSELFVPLKPQSEWPLVKDQEGILGYFMPKRPRTKRELIEDLDLALRKAIPGVDWNFSQNIRDNVLESISGVKGDNSVKIFGPDLNELQRLAQKVQSALDTIPGIENIGVLDIMGQPNLELPIDAVKCNRWGVNASDVGMVVGAAVGGKPFSTMVEGGSRYDISLRWPPELRQDLASILQIPIDISNNQVASSAMTPTPSTKITNSSSAFSSTGSSAITPSLFGNIFNGTLNYIAGTSRVRLKDCVSPLLDDGSPNPEGDFIRPRASMIYRDQGDRMIAVKFSVRGTDLANAVSRAQEVVKPLIEAPYRTEWGGEFEQMKDAELRLMVIVPITLILIFLILYVAFQSLLDAIVVLMNVMALGIGGVWALLLTGTNFSVSAAVGFVSLFGVAIMDGLLLISSFNSLRAHGVPLEEAILQGAEKRVRAVLMTGFTAILGLLPAALAIKPVINSQGEFRLIEPIGVQTQQPLAIVVVGGMITTLLLTRYLMPVLYSFYGNREPAEGSGRMAH